MPEQQQQPRHLQLRGARCCARLFVHFRGSPHAMMRGARDTPYFAGCCMAWAGGCPTTVAMPLNAAQLAPRRAAVVDDQSCKRGAAAVPHNLHRSTAVMLRTKGRVLGKRRVGVKGLPSPGRLLGRQPPPGPASGSSPGAGGSARLSCNVGGEAAIQTSRHLAPGQSPCRRNLRTPGIRFAPLGCFAAAWWLTVVDSRLAALRPHRSPRSGHHGGGRDHDGF